jgi:predicted nucleotidyltransferase
MELREGLSFDDDELADFANRHSIRQLAAFGSVLRSDFNDASDVDLLVEFAPGRTPGFLTIAAMELELGRLLGREIELRSPSDLSRFFRDEVVRDAKVLYAA